MTAQHSSEVWKWFLEEGRWRINYFDGLDQLSNFVETLLDSSQADVTNDIIKKVIREQKWIIVRVVPFCQLPHTLEYLLAEICICSYSIANGEFLFNPFSDFYSLFLIGIDTLYRSLINQDQPIGCQRLLREGAKELGLVLPDKFNERFVPPYSYVSLNEIQVELRKILSLHTFRVKINDKEQIFKPFMFSISDNLEVSKFAFRDDVSLFSNMLPLESKILKSLV